MYVQLFHGRDDPDQDLTEGWGFHGPAIYTRDFQWTYGSWRLEDDFRLTIHPDEMVEFDGCYYGDFCITDKPFEGAEVLLATDLAREQMKVAMAAQREADKAASDVVSEVVKGERD